MKRTWILIADSSGARILEAVGDGRGFYEHAVSSGRRTSSFGTIAQPAHVIEERPSATKAFEALFASQLGAMLAAHLRNNDFDRLVIVAPTSMLDALRKMISPGVREKVVGEIEKDLTNIPAGEISRYLNDVAPLL